MQFPGTQYVAAVSVACSLSHSRPLSLGLPLASSGPLGMGSPGSGHHDPDTAPRAHDGSPYSAFAVLGLPWV